MDYSYIRKLAKNITSLEAKEIYYTLLENGIEVFVKSENEYINVTEDMLLKENELYVSAADLSYARKLIKESGLENYLCNEDEINKNVVKSEIEKAEEEFFRKHKQNQMFALLIIVGVMIFMIIQFIIQFLNI